MSVSFVQGTSEDTSSLTDTTNLRETLSSDAVSPSKLVTTTLIPRLFSKRTSVCRKASKTSAAADEDQRVLERRLLSSRQTVDKLKREIDGHRSTDDQENEGRVHVHW